MSRSQTQSCIQEPLNLSNGGPRQSDLQIADGRIPGSDFFLCVLLLHPKKTQKKQKQKNN